MPDETTAPKWMKPTAEYGPLVVFFLAYWQWDLLTATAWLMGATAITLVIYYIYARNVPMMPLMTAVIVGIFGGLTLWLQDETFIKMKPTIVEALFSVILLGGLAFKRSLLKPLMGHAWPMEERGWYLLSMRFGLFFAAMAVLNEIVWRNFSTDIWVNFKVFGLMGLTLAFAITQAPLMKRYALPLENETSKES